MYLLLGNNITVRKSEILGIFDCDTSTISPITKRFLSKKEKDGLLFSEIDDIPKSYIVTDSGRVILSQLSSSALYKRMQNNSIG